MDGNNAHPFQNVGHQMGGAAQDAGNAQQPNGFAFGGLDPAQMLLGMFNTLGQATHATNMSVERMAAAIETQARNNVGRGGGNHDRDRDNGYRTLKPK